MNSTKTIKNILIGLLVAVALLIGYAMMNPKDGTTNALSSGSLTSAFKDAPKVDDSEVQLANTEILKVLGSIQNIELHDDIFSNPVFRDLRDTRFSIPRPLQIGRSNPFLPIGFDDVTIQTVLDDPVATTETTSPETTEESAEENSNNFYTSGQQV